MSIFPLVTNDASFQIPVEPAATALSTAKSILDWASKDHNRRIFDEFEESLVSELKTCSGDVARGKHTFWLRRNELCCAYYQLRVSEKFITARHSFLGKANCEPLPTFNQQVTDFVFKEMLSTQYELKIYQVPVDSEDITY